MLRASVTAAVLAAAFANGALAQESGNGSTQADVGEVGELYPAEGAGVTYQYCASCHSTMLVAQQGQTREGWDELLQWMVEKQGMQPIPDEDREVILDYLAEHYNTDRPHFPR
jgi:cytochrome c